MKEHEVTILSSKGREVYRADKPISEMVEEQNPMSDELQARLDNLTFEELEAYLESLQIEQDEGKDREGIMLLTKDVIELKVERAIQLKIEHDINTD